MNLNGSIIDVSSEEGPSKDVGRARRLYGQPLDLREAVGRVAREDALGRQCLHRGLTARPRPR